MGRWMYLSNKQTLNSMYLNTSRQNGSIYLTYLHFHIILLIYCSRYPNWKALHVFLNNLRAWANWKLFNCLGTNSRQSNPSMRGMYFIAPPCSFLNCINWCLLSVLLLYFFKTHSWTLKCVNTDSKCLTKLSLWNKLWLCFIVWIYINFSSAETYINRCNQIYR